MSEKSLSDIIIHIVLKKNQKGLYFLFSEEKIPYLKLIPILIISFLLFKAIDNIQLLADGFSIMMSILTPFFWAFSIAYILNPLMVHLERTFKTRRILTIVIVYLIVFGIITLIITIIAPTITDNIGELLQNMPSYARNTQNWFDHTIKKLDLSNNQDIIDHANKALNDMLDILTASLNSTVNLLLNKAIAFTSSFLKMIFGFIISIYILKDKEIFIKNTKKLLYSLFNKNSVKNFLCFGREVDSIFSRYIIGKTIDSSIIGLLCAIGISLIGVPYGLLISLIVGITNMIPYFGPFIGMIPAFIITLLFNPIKAFWVLLFIFILQQFDGFYLGPKILGDQVGVGPFWIILAVIIGGGVAGVLGMFLGVPIIAIIKILLDRFMEKRLKIKNIHNKDI